MAGLFLLPICILATLFVAQANKTIEFVDREIAGVTYLRSIWPIFLDVASEPGTALDVKRIDALDAARKAYDPIFGTAQRSADAMRLLPYLGSSQAAKLEPLVGLISDVGDRSNLILDPGLDSYYMIDSVLQRLPEIVTTTSLLASLRQPNSFSSQEAAGVYASAFRWLGRLQTAIEGNAASQRAAAKDRAAKPGRVRLADSLNALGPVATTFYRSAEMMVRRLAVRSLAGGGADSIIQPQPQALLEATNAVWQNSADEVMGLLQARKSSLRQSLWVALAASGLIVTAALGLAVFIFRKIMLSFDERTVYLARHDAMTALLNRATFLEKLEASLGQGERLAVHYLDIDRFKQVNDTLGHDVGDGLLKAVAGRLARETRTSDLVARLGGDEFIVAQIGDVTTEAADSFTARLIKVLSAAYVVNEHDINVSASIGTAYFPEDGADVASLMKAADMALYQAKADGRNTARVFKKSMIEAIEQRRRLEQILAEAVEKGSFELHFQPVLNKTADLHGFEALIRLTDPDGKPISPALFIPIAEELGLILAIDEWTLRQTCRFAVTWPRQLSIAVNISPLRFGSGDLAQMVEKILVETGLEPHRLELEVTERLLLDNSAHVVEQFSRLRKLGVRILMDDFGSGNSSLSYLWQFPFDGIKIDRSFIMSLSSDDASRKRLLSSFVTMGHALGITVTAEGIETAEQEDLVLEIACDRMQGYRFARPLPQKDVSGYILIQSGLPAVAREALAAPTTVHARLMDLRRRFDTIKPLPNVASG